MKRRKGQALVEYILLTVLAVLATIIVVRFVVYDVFGGSMTALSDKTSKCVSTGLRRANQKCE